MELEEMSELWTEMSKKKVKQKGLRNQSISDITKLKYSIQANTFRVSEIIGLVLAYTLTSGILYAFNTLDTWYLRACGIFLVIYLLIMPLYSMAVGKRMQRIDLAKSSYKDVLEHFFSFRSRLKQAENISLAASPLILVASIALLTKVFVGKDLFKFKIQLPIVLLIAIIFIGVILFNNWAFKKRRESLQSVKQLLEEGN